ncbi:hypothetical protein [Chakrabartyella piscis]|uniref:hypothetical protein n=1 Tax=Chakrabartyella piscis TaxID=2918914 RepID=UPI0029585574|nr:hypothetical protein [Chakrabartyella piscis]
METRSANVIMAKAGGNASSNSYNCKISLPKKWLDQMNVNIEKRGVELSFDGDRIFIERPPMSGIKIVPLANPKKIHQFALVWIELYKHYETVPFYFFEDIEFVGEGLADLGFIMDCGESFNRQFPHSHMDDLQFNQRELNQLDLQTLGNTIFSQWRDWNHWRMAPMEAKDFEWFVVTLSGLAELTK